MQRLSVEPEAVQGAHNGLEIATSSSPENLQGPPSVVQNGSTAWDLTSCFITMFCERFLVDPIIRDYSTTGDDPYHRRFVRVCKVFSIVGGICGAFLGLFVLGTMLFAPDMIANGGKKANGPDRANWLLSVVLAPACLGAFGFLFGVALMGLFAPYRYLAGPNGQQWMKHIGTNSVLVARIVCLSAVTLVGGAALWIVVAILVSLISAPNPHATLR